MIMIQQCIYVNQLTIYRLTILYVDQDSVCLSTVVPNCSVILLNHKDYFGTNSLKALNIMIFSEIEVIWFES